MTGQQAYEADVADDEPLQTRETMLIQLREVSKPAQRSWERGAGEEKDGRS